MQTAVIEALQIWSERGGSLVTDSQPSNEIEEETDDSTTSLLCVVESPPDIENVEFLSRNDSADSVDTANELSDELPSFPGHLAPLQLTNEITGSRLVQRASITSLPKELWHSEQLEYFNRAIEWLEKAITDFETFEKMWEEKKLPTAGRSRFTLPAIVFPGFL